MISAEILQIGQHSIMLNYRMAFFLDFGSILVFCSLCPGAQSSGCLQAPTVHPLHPMQLSSLLGVLPSPYL